MVANVLPKLELSSIYSINIVRVDKSNIDKEFGNPCCITRRIIPHAWPDHRTTERCSKRYANRPLNCVSRGAHAQCDGCARHGCQMAKFDPFLSLDCARVEGMGAQSKESKGSNFAAQRSGAIVQKPEGPNTFDSKNSAIAIWQPCLTSDCLAQSKERKGSNFAI